MRTQDCNILQILEPTIKLRPLEITDTESNHANGRTAAGRPRETKWFSNIPMICINGFNLDKSLLQYFELNMNAFLPTIKVKFLDLENAFKSMYYPTDGSVIQVLIGSKGDEKKFNPIRCDFTITNIYDNGCIGYQEYGDANIYTISGVLRIPKSLARESHVEEDTSFNSLLNISEITELGFASNVEYTNDSQKWVNLNDQFQDYINSITNHAYIDDNNFFTSFIDCFYNLNFVEVDRLFTQDGDKSSNQSMIFKIVPNIVTNNKDDDSKDQELAAYSITNNPQRMGWTNYIEYYSELSKSSSTLYSGYRKYVQYFDFNNREFVSEYVDPLTHNTKGMIPLSKGKIYNNEPEDNLRNTLVSYTYYGFQDTDSQHENYYWAGVQNQFNNEESKKFGLDVTLCSYNPAITRYSRIWVDIYELNSTMIANKRLKDNNKDIGNRNADMPPVLNPELDENTGDMKQRMIYNESLSGWYLVESVNIFYDLKDAMLKHKLILNRRESKPANKLDVMSKNELL